MTSAAFSPDGRHIVTASDDQTARVWDVSVTMLDASALGALLDKRIRHLGIRFSSDECALYFSADIGPHPEECRALRTATPARPDKRQAPRDGTGTP